MSQPAVEFRGITKRFGGKTAVAEIDLQTGAEVRRQLQRRTTVPVASAADDDELFG